MSLDVYLVNKGTITWNDGTTEPHSEELYNGNITHNLTDMAEEAGLYKALWRPEENDINNAVQLVGILETGLSFLKDQPDHFKTFNPSNGLGTYEGLILFLEEYLEACKEHPYATVITYR